MDIEHQQGSQHSKSGGLSRRPCPDCRHCELEEQRDGGHEKSTIDGLQNGSSLLRQGSDCPRASNGQHCATVTKKASRETKDPEAMQVLASLGCKY